MRNEKERAVEKLERLRHEWGLISREQRDDCYDDFALGIWAGLSVGIEAVRGLQGSVSE
jgi:hypothetical protein